MAYDEESYYGTKDHRVPTPSEGADSKKLNTVLASPRTAGRFADIIKFMRPDKGLGFGRFVDVLQHEGRPLAVTFNPEANRIDGADQPFGLAAAYNVVRHRRWLWDKGRNPGIYTIAKTIYVKRAWSAGDQIDMQDDLKAIVSETTHPLVVYGKPESRTAIRPATEDEVVQAIELVTEAYDATFMAAAGVTTVHAPIDSLSNRQN